MIATLEGRVQYQGDGYLVVNVGGVGFQVYVSESTLGKLETANGKVLLHTYLQLREDNIVLYGFASQEELALFKKLISVSGIGPKVALALLSALTEEQLIAAISTGNEELLSQVPGIGKKTASRLILELRGKLEKKWKEIVQTSPLESADVVAALTSLGYSLTEATKAASKLPCSPELSLEDKIRIALQQMAKG